MEVIDEMYENDLWHNKYEYIAGVDEVGRGCFAGPIVAAAVILPKHFPFMSLMQDSKTLPERKREKLSAVIKLYALAYSISEISVEVINSHGIGFANQLVMRLAVTRLSKKPDFILVDGFKIKSIKSHQQKEIVHGDSLNPSIAAASILAKVYRDNLMKKVHVSYPQYHFFKNKGYGTKEHREALHLYGLSPHHRTSFNLEKFIT